MSNGTVNISQDNGQTFSNSSPGAARVASIDSSSDFTYLIVGEDSYTNPNGGVFLSSNAGLSWTKVITENTGNTYGNFTNVYISPTGQYQLAFNNYNGSYNVLRTSINYGSNFQIVQSNSVAVLATSLNSQIIGGELPAANGLAELSNALVIASGKFVETAQLNASSINTFILSTNTLVKANGSFDIAHPLGIPGRRLVHSFIEGPRADLLYRGEAKLAGGEACVDLEREATANGSALTPGTFEALATHPQVFLHNADTFDRVKGSVSSHFLHITSQNPTSEAHIQWMVLAERHDPVMKAWDRCDSNGFLVLEY
jgi:hypothetical protein